MWVFTLASAVIIAGICLKIRSMDFMKKLAAKIVLVYLAMGWVLLCAWLVAFSSRELYEGGYAGTREARLRRAEQALEEGEIDQAMTDMLYDKSFEEEFDFAWERGTMYQLYGRYMIFAQAAGVDPVYAGEAQRYRERLLQVCADSECPENALYVEYYLRELEKE